MSQVGRTIDSLQPPLPEQLQTIQMLASGFIVTSLLWGAALAALIDRRLRVSSLFFAIAAVCSLFGVIHSPYPDERLVLPWSLPAPLPHAASGQTPFYLATAYLAVALLLLVWDYYDSARSETEKAR